MKCKMECKMEDRNMKVRELIKKIRDFDGIEIRDFETNKRLVKSFSIKNVQKYLDCEVKDYDYYDTLEDYAFSEYSFLKIFI